MWVFILLYILGLNISQATGKDNSTQMYYVKLTMDESAIGNLTEILKPFVNDTRLNVDDLQKTTTCKSVYSGTECTCEPHHRWSDKICQSKQKCCGKEKCTFPKISSPKCVSDNTVTVIGSIILDGQQFLDCLTEKQTLPFQQCNKMLLKEMKTVYSTLRGFDSITITKYRVGSVIADFEMTIAHNVKPQDLSKNSIDLCQNLSALLFMETTGIVHLQMSPNPVCYNYQCNLTCTVKEDLSTDQPAWQLERGGQVFNVTNGTGSMVTSQKMETKVIIKNTSEIWAGVYTCVYTQQKPKLYTILHKASAVLDIALLPNIDISMTPSFPHCQKSSDLLEVRVQCALESSDESYKVTWKVPPPELRPIDFSSAEGTHVHTSDIIVSCNSSERKPQIICAFKNRCNQERTASIYINIIYEGDQFCEADGDWADTKAGFTAVLKCKNAAGQRLRKCKNGTTQAAWETEVSECVNQEVNDMLHKANIADIGLGSLHENAANVFSILGNITNNTQSIDTFANINTSVQVLLTLSQKQNLYPNESTTNDFLESSSNLLDNSLSETWGKNVDRDNTSLAERYLSSVERLIQMANITGAPYKKNVEVATHNCSKRAQCKNSVFDVTIKLQSSDPGRVKTAGFKQLEKYLPNNNDDYMPNSIVVSTFTERKQLDSVMIEINFKLLKPRPRNVRIQCASWDNNTRSWSDYKCTWSGASNEGQCVCEHLSTFVMLIAKNSLEIPGITEITYVGLCVSIVSLVISLAIELTVWSNVVKTNSLHLRHTAHVNISLCLLVADCCFLASSKPRDISLTWCKTFVVLKHFCYLSMFFWMLCLSVTLLHQAVFPFHNVGKKNYLRFALVLGYVCPLLIVTITFIANRGGSEGLYFSRDTCWLIYTGLMKGSIFAFVVPVGIIVFVNLFSMLVVIMKLLDHPRNTETSHDRDKKAAKTVIRSVVLLTPVFGVTWLFGFAVMLLDLTTGNIALAANYVFTLLNAFQGLFILLTTCLGDKLTRDALLKRLRNIAPASTTDSSTKLDSSWIK